jgi:RecA-family ATPase
MNVISLEDRLEHADVMTGGNAVTITATPYVWRSPESIPERQWIYGRILSRGSLSMLVAPGASGKTALTAGMALAMASGRNLLGQTVWNGRKRVWLWNLEDSAEELDRLIQAGCKHWG